jgi:hypothetical protein
MATVCFNSEFTKKIDKITYKTDKNTNIFVILLVLFAFQRKLRPIWRSFSNEYAQNLT